MWIEWQTLLSDRASEVGGPRPEEILSAIRNRPAVLVLGSSWALAAGLAAAAPAEAAERAAVNAVAPAETAAHAATAAQEAAPADKPCGWTGDPEIGARLAPLVARRQAKCAELEPYRPGFLERQILAFEKAERPAISEVNVWGFYPRIQTIDHRSQIGVGARFWQPDVGASRFDLAGNAFWTFQGFGYFDAQVGWLPHQGTSFPLFALKTDDVFELGNVRVDDDRPGMLYGSYSYRWAPKFDFFGIGPDTRRDDQAGFRQKDILTEAVAGYRVLTHLTLAGRFGYLRSSTGRGTDEDLPQLEDVFTPAQAPGYGETLEFWRYGAYGVLDFRDVAKNPHSGGLLAFEWTRFDDRGERFDFERYALDGRLYLPLGHPQRMLALRGYLSRDDPRDGSLVPFNMLSFLGNSRTLRSFLSQRLRGAKLALVSAEYRVEGSPALELAFFVDHGTVAAGIDDAVADFGDWKTSYGFGLRFKSHQAVLIRTDFAWGEEGFRFLFRFSPGI